MYTIENDITLSEMTKIIQSFELNEKIKMKKYKSYYDNKHEICKKTVQDTSKPCNKIVTNFCSEIVDNYLGYLCGVPISYSGDNMENVQGVLDYNDVTDEDTEYLKDCLIYGVAYEVVYVDEDAKERFGLFNPLETIPVYDRTLSKNLKYVIRYYLVDSLDETQGYYVELYDDKQITRYKCSNLFDSLRLDEVSEHYFGICPISVFQLNRDCTSIFDKVMTLQDAYNTLLSSEVDDFEAFCDAYMVLKGVVADNDDLKSMKENRVLLLDTDSSAEYLTKQVNSQQIQQLLMTIESNIRKISACVDFSDVSFGTASGVAMKFKLLGMANKGNSIINNMTKALRKRIELICAIQKLTNDEIVWREVSIVFTPNIPSNEMEIAQMLNSLRGICSDKTLLSQLPFVKDVDKEMEQLQEQAPTMDYSFGGEGA